MKTSLVRPLQIITAAFALMMVAVFLLLGVLAYRNDRRIRTARESLARVDEAQAACLGAKNTRTTGSRGTCQAAVAREHRKAAEMVSRMLTDTDREVSITLIAPVLLLAVMAAVVLYSRARVFEPLRALGGIVSRLSEGELKPAPVVDADPVVLPLYENYNRLVLRLQQLEEAHRLRAQSLTEEVRAATRALLAQQQTLSRAERLAATGELAASVAHELRNPLASICGLRHDVRAGVKSQPAPSGKAAIRPRKHVRGPHRNPRGNSACGLGASPQRPLSRAGYRRDLHAS